MNETFLRIVRTMADAPEMDLEQRILRRVVVATRRLASDGWIIEPMGIDLSRYVENPIVTADHDPVTGKIGEVIGRSLSLERDTLGLISATQFADTEKGREYAYLYGLNAKKEVFMRAWSIEGSILARASLSFGQAQSLLGPLWDQNMADILRAKGATAVSIADKFLMRTYAATGVGADRGALTRACGEGVRVAGELVATLDLVEIRREMNLLRKEFTTKIETFEQQLLALRGDGAAAAARGDTAELLDQLRELSELAREKR
jgi:hypothetical protein